MRIALAAALEGIQRAGLEEKRVAARLAQPFAADEEIENLKQEFKQLKEACPEDEAKPEPVS
jgi:hypothetical protein